MRGGRVRVRDEQLLPQPEPFFGGEAVDRYEPGQADAMLSGEEEEGVARLGGVEQIVFGTVGFGDGGFGGFGQEVFRGGFPGLDEEALAVADEVGVRQVIERLQLCNGGSVLFGDFAQRFTRLDDVLFRGGCAGGGRHDGDGSQDDSQCPAGKGFDVRSHKFAPMIKIIKPEFGVNEYLFKLVE